MAAQLCRSAALDSLGFHFFFSFYVVVVVDVAVALNHKT